MADLFAAEQPPPPEEAPITGAEALHVLETIFAFYEAARTGRTQSV